MAYIKRVVDPCYNTLCDKEARWEVFSRWNSSLGKFCRHHAEQIKRQQHEREVDCAS